MSNLVDNSKYKYIKNQPVTKTDTTNVTNYNAYQSSALNTIPKSDSFYKSQTNAPNLNQEKISLREEFEKTKKEQGIIGKTWNGIKNFFGMKSGSNEVEKAIKQYERGKITKEEATEILNKYKEGQNTCVDVFADISSGILSIAAFTFAVPTGGASLGIGLGLATAVGAGVKVGIKAGDANKTGKKYSGKNLLYDTVTGGINGLLAPITNGIGNTVTKTIGKKLIKEGAEEVVEQAVKQGLKQSAKNVILNQTVDIAGGSIAKRAVAFGTGMAVDGALGGASDNMLRAALNGENVLEAGLEGAVGGAIMSPIIGGGFNLAGKAGRALNNTITTKIVLPDGVSTKFKQGTVGDCALLSTIDGMMQNSTTAKTFKKSITKTIGGDYNVKIGNNIIKVSKSSLTDEMLSDTTGIRIFEQAYKQLTGDIDGGFAEVVAKQFGLNPVHITNESITDELLDKLASNQGDTILSFGTVVDKTGAISPNGQRHYFTIKNIDADSKTITLTSPIDTSAKIQISYDQAKSIGISIDGGSIKELDLPNSVRNADDVKFRGVKSSIDDAINAIIAKDSYEELDENTVRNLLNAMSDDGSTINTNMVKNVINLIEDLTYKLDDFQYEDPENIPLVLNFLEKAHKLIGIEDIVLHEMTLENIKFIQIIESIMDGDELSFDCSSPEVFEKFASILKKSMKNATQSEKIEILKEIIRSNHSIDTLYEQAIRLSSEFSEEDLCTIFLSLYTKNIPEEDLVSNLKNLKLSSKVFSLISPENIQETHFNKAFASVIGELNERGYNTEEIALILKYRFSEFLDREFIKNPNIKLFADTIENLNMICDSEILIDYTKAQEPFNEILTLPIENVDEIPMPNIDFTDKSYSFTEAKENVKCLESVLKEVRTPRNLTVYRGEGYEVLEQYLLASGETLGSAIKNGIKSNDKDKINKITAEILGAEITQSHFLSTAYDKGEAMHFVKHDGGILWEINVPKGSQGLYVDPFNSENGAECEILFNRNRRLRIIDASVENGILKIKANML